MIYLDVTIMGQPYRLACKEGEQAPCATPCAISTAR